MFEKCGSVYLVCFCLLVLAALCVCMHINSGSVCEILSLYMSGWRGWVVPDRMHCAYSSSDGLCGCVCSRFGQCVCVFVSCVLSSSV